MRHTFNDIPGKPEVYLDHQVEEPYKAPGIASSITRPGKPGETLNTIFSQTVDNPFSAISATRPRLAARLLLSLSLSLALFHPSVPLQQPIQSQIGPPGLIGVVEIGPVAASSTLPPPPSTPLLPRAISGDSFSTRKSPSDAPLFVHRAPFMKSIRLIPSSFA